MKTDYEKMQAILKAWDGLRPTELPAPGTPGPNITLDTLAMVAVDTLNTIEGQQQ